MALIVLKPDVASRKNLPMPFRLVGRGEAGISAADAALFGKSVQEVIIADPPASHRDGPHFLGVLRVLDIPEALGLLAPSVKPTLWGRCSCAASAKSSARRC